MRKYLCILLVLAFALPAPADLLRGSGGGTAGGPSFEWDMETTTANTYTSDGSATLTYTATLSTDYAHSGAKSLKCSGTYDLAEFDSRPAVNLDFDFDEGTIEFYVLWTGTWVASASFFMLKNEDYAENLYIQNRATQGQARFNWKGPTAAAVYATSGTLMIAAETWYKVTCKWRRSASPYLTVLIDDVAGTNYTAGVPEQATHDEAAIIAGNDTGSAMTFYIDDLKIWKTWQ